MAELLKKRIGLALVILCTAGSLVALSLIDLAPFRVQYFQPGGDLLKQPGEIEIRFTRALIDDQSFERGTARPAAEFFSVTPALSGEWRYKSASAVVFRPAADALRPNTRYTVQVKAGLRAADGSVLMLPARSSFVFDRLTAVGCAFEGNDKRMELKPDLVLAFNHALDLATAGAITLTASDGRNVPLTLVQLTNRPTGYVYYRKQFVNWTYIRERVHATGSQPLYSYRLRLPELAPNTVYALRIGEGLATRTGDQTLAAEAVFEFSTYGPLRIAEPERDLEQRPGDWVTLRFSNPLKMKPEAISNLIEARTGDGRPARILSINTWDGSDSVTLAFDFAARSEYRVTVKAGALDVFGQPMREAASFLVRTGDFAPDFDVPYPNRTLVECDGRIRDFPMSFINLLSLKADVEVCHDPAALYSRTPSLRKNLWLTAQIAKRNTRYLQKIDFAPLLKDGKYGHVRVRVSGRYDTSESYDRDFENEYVLQFTGLSLTVKAGPGGCFIHVTELATAAPAALVPLEVADAKTGKVLWRGQADATGVAQIMPAHPAFADMFGDKGGEKSLRFVARRGDDFTVLDRNYENMVYLYNTEIGYPSSRVGKIMAHLFTPKGLYKKDETVLVKGYVRTAMPAGLAVPDARRYRLTCQAPDGKEVLSRIVTLSDWGSFDESIALPSDPPLGRWQLRLVAADAGPGDRDAAEGSFMVEAYRERDFEVAAAIGKSGAVHLDGEMLPFQVRANYLYGGRMRDGKLKLRVEAYPHLFVAKSGLLRDYSFASPLWFDPSSAEGPQEKTEQTVVLSRVGLALDKQGEYASSLPPARVPFACAARYVFSAEVEDQKRQSIVASAATIVHKGDFLLGFRMPSYFIGTEEPLLVDLLAVTPDERSAGARAVDVRVYREEWNNVRKLSADGYFRWHYERKYMLVTSERAVTTADPANPRRLAFRVNAPGAYVITFRARDGAGREITNLGYFYAWGGGSVPWRMNDDQTIGLVRDKDLYRPGETARIMVKSPYKKIDALVTVEREGVLESFRVTLNGGADTIRVPIRAGYVPNVFVSVFLLQGRLENRYPDDLLKDIYKPTVKVGYTVLNIDREHKRLRVAARTDRETYEPGDRVNLALSATDAAGNGVAAELSVYAVDEGVLSIIGYATPDPLAAFFDRQRQLQVFSYDSRLRVLGQHGYAAKGENPGGDKGGDENRRSSLGLSNLKLRQLFNAVAFSRSDIVTDAAGRASASFTLPDNLTKYRIMVIAADRGDRFGSSESRITVSKGLVLRPALPRFLATGDRISAGFVVDNNTAQAGTVNVSATARGVTLKGEPAAFRLEPGASREVRYEISATTPGEAAFEFSAAMTTGAARFGDRLAWKIPVTAGPMRRALVKSDELVGALTNQTYALPADAVPGTAEWQVFASSTALARLAGAFDHLFGYPYGCLEQKLARVLPMLVAGDMVKSFGGAPGVDHRKLVQEYLDELDAYRDKAGGGYHVWPEREYQHLVNPVLSTTLLFTLHTARVKGYAVNDAVWRQAVEWTRDYLARSRFSTAAYPHDERYWVGADALALYTLAEAGLADDSYADAIYAKIGDQPLYVKITLAQALLALGREKHKGRIFRLMTDLAGAVRYEGDFAYFREDFSRWDWSRNFYLSDVKTMGAALNFLLKAEPGSRLIPLLTRGLVRLQRNGAWRTTQENMYACWAFASYFEIREREMPAFSFTIGSVNRILLSGVFAGRTFLVRNAVWPFVAQPGRDIQTIDFAKRGPGRLYYTTRLAYVSSAEARRENAGFEVARSYFDAQGNPVTSGRFRAGQSYKVVLKVGSERPRHDVVVEDPLPAGLEAINPRLERTSLDVDAARDTGGRHWCWFGFNRVMMKDDRVCLFADTLTAETHEYSYFVKAVTPGEYASFPARAEEMYNPDIYGQTASGRVVVE